MSLLVAYALGFLVVYAWMIIARSLLSWVEPNPHNVFVQFLVWATEPVLRPLRRIVPPERTAGFDISPLLALLLIEALRSLLRAPL